MLSTFNFETGIMRKISTLLSFIIFLLFVFAGCERFEGEQEVPAYLHIDAIDLSVSSAFPGITPTHDITDAWVYVDDWLLGAFQLPATIPVLKKGSCKVMLRPGVLFNNQSYQRHAYPFYNSIEKTVVFQEDSTTSLTGLKTTVTNTTRFWLNETFEDANFSFQIYNGKGKGTFAQKRTNEMSVETPMSLYGANVAYIGLTKPANVGDSTQFCTIISKEAFNNLPFNQDIFVEIDYCSNNKFVVGIQCNNGGALEHYDIAGGGATEDFQWRKIYVDITRRVTQQLNSGCTDFKIYIMSYIEAANNGGFVKDEATIYLDNIRLVYKNSGA